MEDETEDRYQPAPGELEKRSTAVCPIVGIGASAGGIDALKRLFPNVEPGCDLAFVVVQHLDPDHESILPDILARSSRLPVSPIEDETEIEPNYVYVLPPNASLTIRGGQLQLGPLSNPRGHRNPIDELLISLASDQGDNAACVILSGTGSDGTLGLRAIKEHGGLTLAQAEAEYDGMMRSAVATGLVDFVLRAEEIPAKLVDYFRHIVRVDHEKGPNGVQTEAADYLAQITMLLRAQTGHDFSSYKDRTIIRRVERRMHVLQIDSVPRFIERLRRDPSEITLLFQDLLIGVTNFFRDPEAFEALEKTVVPELFEGKGLDDTIRVWVPGCATGEEAYSIGILLREYASQSSSGPKLQIFATDIDEQALENARACRYPATIAKDVSPQRLDRYFQREEGTYKVAGDLREMCLFSTHNLLRDAPFSKLDLIACRNLLIYLSGDLQDRVIPLFHYALNPNGYLFLGTSENVTRHPRLFTTVDKSHRIFRRRPLLELRIPEFPLSTPPNTRRRGSQPNHRGVAAPSLKAQAERQLLDRFAPAYVVINAEGDLLQSSGRTGKYLELPAGAPDINIFNLARPGLRLELRAALHRAIGNEQLSARSKVAVGVNGGRQEIDLYIQPLRFGTPADTLYMVVFQDLGPIKLPAEAEQPASLDDLETTNVRQLEAELRSTREKLQTTSEELEASNEELKSSNEELQSINEELQSTNEELETSKEELQSINEELQTVNSELNSRIEELSRVNNDIINLLENTQIATVFLDCSLNVKSFTPAAKDVFRLVESDAGRPLLHVRARFDTDMLQEDAERVLRTLATIERPIKSTEGDVRYIMRMMPYRTTDNVINGVVITFTDVTHLSAAEARIEQLAGDLRERVGELETLLELVPVGVMMHENSEGGKSLINSYGARLLGTETRTRGLFPIAAPLRLFDNGTELPLENHPLQTAARTGETVPEWRGQLQNARGGSVHTMISATPLFTNDGTTRGAIAAIVDMSSHRHAEEQQQALLHELQHRVKNVLATVSSLATRMARTYHSIDGFQNAFLSRLNAMGRVHDLLSGGAWTGASLRSLIEATVEPLTAVQNRNVQLDGSEMRLTPNAASTLGMVLHELVTNAAKYGALSSPGGQVDIGWKRIDGDQPNDQRVQMTWSEHKGPTVHGFATAGFGTGFITRSMEYELGGAAHVEIKPGGVTWIITFPVKGNIDLDAARRDP
jgi:two-component system, chemotaxis family, CheB/CheR fusion protein